MAEALSSCSPQTRWICMTKRSIATVSLSGTLDEKLRAIAAAGFDTVEIFENDFLSFGGSPRDVGQLCRDLGLEICAFQPFRDFEGMPEPQRTRNFARAERKFDVMQELQTDLLLICSNVSAGLARRHRPRRRRFSRARRAAPRGAACASASRRWPGDCTSTITAMPGRSCGAPTTNRSASFSTASISWRRRFRPRRFHRSRRTRYSWCNWPTRRSSASTCCPGAGISAVSRGRATCR